MQEQDFRSLGLIEPLLETLKEEGYAAPTPIQAKTIPTLLKGQDLLGVAQTGTGKTAAFALSLSPSKFPNISFKIETFVPIHGLSVPSS